MTVSETPIAANFNKALDIEVNLSSKLPLNPILPVNNLPQTINLPFSKRIRLDLRTDISLSQNPLTQSGANAVDIL